MHINTLNHYANFGPFYDHQKNKYYTLVYGQKILLGHSEVLIFRHSQTLD